MISEDQRPLPGAVGILRCLELLADEAEALDLRQTARAIQYAIETITRESPAAKQRYRPAMH
jgi:hypothetical protein